MNDTSNLVDNEVNFILPLMIIGVVAVMALVMLGFFMPSPDWIF